MALVKRKEGHLFTPEQESEIRCIARDECLSKLLTEQESPAQREKAMQPIQEASSFWIGKTVYALASSYGANTTKEDN